MTTLLGMSTSETVRLVGCSRTQLLVLIESSEHIRNDESASNGALILEDRLAIIAVVKERLQCPRSSVATTVESKTSALCVQQRLHHMDAYSDKYKLWQKYGVSDI